MKVCSFTCRTVFTFCILFGLVSCVKDSEETDAPIGSPIGFKFVDSVSNVQFENYQDYLTNKPTDFYDRPFLINHDGERIELEPIKDNAKGIGLRFRYSGINWSSIHKRYRNGVSQVSDHLMWQIHFSPLRIDTMKFGVTYNYLKYEGCDTVATADPYKPGTRLEDLNFLQYNSDTIIRGCLGDIFLDTNYIGYNIQNQIFIPTKL